MDSSKQYEVVATSGDTHIDPEAQQNGTDYGVEEDKRDASTFAIEPADVVAVKEKEPMPSRELSLSDQARSISNQLSKSISQHTKRRHEGTVLEWSGISYSVPVAPIKNSTEPQPDRRTLLHPMSGAAHPGKLMAVMGTSGAGKSTLLDVLSGRLESSDVHGHLTTNGKEVYKSSFRKETGYVMQSDALFPHLTVRETIRYAAYLRVANATTEEKEELAEGIIKLLRLESAADTKVGDDDVRGISGGEKRRVSIGVDIVHFPAIIFLDEPTSGLDSTTAASIVQSLKALAEELNCTIVMTIHQPSARLFQSIDSLLFLSAGHVTFYGTGKELTSYTNEIYEAAGLFEVPLGNPPEVFLDLCDYLVAEDKLDLVTARFVCNDSQRSLVAVAEDKESLYANGMMQEMGILMNRAMLNVVRTGELFFARFFIAIFNAVMLGTLFLDTNQDQEGFKHRASYFFFTIAFFYFTSLEALPIFLAEREIFQREYSRGAYRASTYAIATQVVMLPFLLLIGWMYVTISWWLVDLPNTADAYFFQVLCVFTVLVAGNSFSTMLSTIIPNPMAGQTYGSALFAVMFLFSGNFILREDIPPYWIWIHYLSLFKYAYESMLVNAFKNYVETDTLSNEDILKEYDIDGIDRGTGVGAMWIFAIAFRLFFYYRLTTAFSGSRK